LFSNFSWRQQLVCLLKDIDLQLFGVLQVVASQDWPEVTKYAGLVSAQAHRQELIEDLYNVTHDPQRGTIHGGMIRYAQRDPHKNLEFSSFCCTFRLKSCIHSVACICRELLISFKRSTGEKPQRILFYRYPPLLKFIHVLSQMISKQKYQP
jgi:hypothetical protein